MKARYIGPTFYPGSGGLTNNKIYEILGEEYGNYRVIDDSGEDYLYSKINPGPPDGSTGTGKWEIIEE